MTSRRTAARRGITVIALLIVIIVIGILAAIANIAIKVDGAGRYRDPAATASVTGFDWASRGRSQP